MNKRITLQSYEIDLIVSALKDLRDQTTLDYEVIKIGKREIDRMIEKLRADTKVSGLAATGSDAKRSASNPPKETQDEN